MLKYTADVAIYYNYYANFIVILFSVLMNPEYGLVKLLPPSNKKTPKNTKTHVANKTFHRRRIATGVLTHVMKYVLVSPSNV